MSNYRSLLDDDFTKLSRTIKKIDDKATKASRPDGSRFYATASKVQTIESGTSPEAAMAVAKNAKAIAERATLPVGSVVMLSKKTTPPLTGTWEYLSSQTLFGKTLYGYERTD